jgi:hydrogenase maturation factor
MPLPAGKLPPALLERCLRWRGARDRRVLVGPRCGEDAAVVALGRRRLVLKSDPVTFTARRIGWYAVHVNANDVATMGARPSWFQPTVLLPPGTRAQAVLTIFRDIHATCRLLGIAVTGGHTEVTDAVLRPVVAGDMQGLLVGSRVVTSAGARPGDVVLLSKAAGLEGTAILAEERARALAARVPRRILRAARALRDRPGISVVADATIAARLGATAMHDPTEGGVRAALHEIAYAAGVRLRVDVERVAVLPPTAVLCRHFGIDPLGLLGSGALVVTVPPTRAGAVLRAWRRAGIAGQAIGAVVRGRGVVAARNGRRTAFPWTTRDEIITALA